MEYSLLEAKWFFFTFCDPDSSIRCTLEAFVEVNESFIAVTDSRYWLFISKREMMPTVLFWLFILTGNEHVLPLSHIFVLYLKFS